MPSVCVTHWEPAGQLALEVQPEAPQYPPRNCVRQVSLSFWHLLVSAHSPPIFCWLALLPQPTERITQRSKLGADAKRCMATSGRGCPDLTRAPAHRQVTGSAT